jgi:hypothetical protein
MSFFTFPCWQRSVASAASSSDFSFQSSSGFSLSPPSSFPLHGNVIGVHAAHVDEEEDVSIGGQKTKVVDASPFRIAMRIDLVRGVLRP